MVSVMSRKATTPPRTVPWLCFKGKVLASKSDTLAKFWIAHKHLGGAGLPREWHALRVVGRKGKGSPDLPGRGRDA